MLGGSSDGAIHIWTVKRGPYQTANIIIPNAHAQDTSVLAICPSPSDLNIYASRGADSTVKVWDITKYQNGPLFLFSGLHTVYPTANITFR
jgi:WD40 repeat protein